MSGKGRIYRYRFYFTKKNQKILKYLSWIHLFCLLRHVFNLVLVKSPDVDEHCSKQQYWWESKCVLDTYNGCHCICWLCESDWTKTLSRCPSCITQLLLQLRISFLPLRTAQWKHINIRSVRFIYCSQSVTPADIDHDCATWPVNYSKYQWMVYWYVDKIQISVPLPVPSICYCAS